MTRPAAITAGQDARSYAVKPHNDLWGYGFNWAVRLYGQGHWCRSDGQKHLHQSREAAEQAGVRWLIEGR